MSLSIVSGHFPPILRPQNQHSNTSQDFTSATRRSSKTSNDNAAQEKRSLDLTQRIERKLAEYNASNNIFKRWLLELICWSISALCMGAVVGIYLRINGQLLSDHQSALSCANVLGKVASAALIVPTSEALGQLKWNWFHDSKAIWDFEIFDKATRGPWGAALLLYRTKGRSLAALGALLIVLLLAIDSFFQQVVQHHDRWALETIHGAIPRVVNFMPPFKPSFVLGYEASAENKDISSALRPFFYHNGTEPIAYGNGTRPEIPLSCPTSKCEWPEYETLAVCSKCEEVSSALNITYTCLNTTVDWSAKYVGPAEVPYSNGIVCGHFVNATSESPVLLTGFVAEGTDDPSTTGEALLVRLVPLTNWDTKMPEYGTGSIKFANVRQPILDALIASTPNGTDSIIKREAPVVNECMLSWCIQRLRSTYEWGTYDEEVLSTYIDETGKDAPWPWYTYPLRSGVVFNVYNQSLTITPSDQGRDRSNSTLYSRTYSMDNNTAANVMNLFDDIFPSSYTAATPDAEPLMRYFNYGQPYTRELFSNPWQAPENQSAHFKKIAKAITNVVRSSTDRVMLPGEAYSMKNFIKIRWAWLVFPFALLLLSLAFLVSTMQKTSKDGGNGVWKTSAMPTLIYGLPKDTREKLTTSSTWNSSHRDARKVRIKLLPDLGWRVSGQSILTSPLLPVQSAKPPQGWI